MPREPKNFHPVRHLREMIGKTQGQWATMLGTSKATVQSIELWRMTMSEQFALNLRQQTGCVPFRTGKKPISRFKVYSCYTFEEYTLADYERHRKALQSLAEQDFKEHALSAARCVNLLVYAAARRGGGHVLTIRDDLERFVIQVCRQHDLGPQVEAVAREGTLPYIGLSEDPVAGMKSFVHAPLNTACTFLLPTEETAYKNTV